MPARVPIGYYLGMAPDGSLAATYDEFARTYDANRKLFDISGVMDDLTARLPKTGDLLDLGCGAGVPTARDFASRGWSVTGVDISEGMLDLAARYVPSMNRIHSDMRDARFAPHSFDAVTAIYSLFHVPWPDHPALFKRISDWLRPEGVLLFTYATRDYTGHDIFNGTMEFMGRELFYSHTTPAELEHQLAEARLDVIDARNRTIGGETFLWVTAAHACQNDPRTTGH